MNLLRDLDTAVGLPAAAFFARYTAHGELQLRYTR